MGSSISVENDTNIEFLLWFELYGGGAPWGGYYGDSLENQQVQKVIQPGNTIIKGFTLSLILKVCIKIDKNDIVYLSVFSPSTAGQVRKLKVSQILQDRFCFVKPIKQGQKYQKAFIYYYNDTIITDLEPDCFFDQPFQEYSLFRFNQKENFKQIDDKVGLKNIN